MYSFGSGVLIGTRTDIANGTPINFGLIQDVTIDETAETKELYGQYQRSIALARGKIKTTGKAKVAKISGIAMASLYYGYTPAPGQVATSFAEAGAVPAVTPFTVTTTNSATWVADGGVVYASTGLPLTQVATSPTAGQYSVAAGVYTFSTGDAGKAVLITYTYTIPATGQKFTVTNQLMGTTPTFSVMFYTTFQGDALSLQLNKCVSSKFTFQTKLDDFVIPEFDFEAFADAAGNVMTWSYAEAS